MVINDNKVINNHDSDYQARTTNYMAMQWRDVCWG